MNIAQVQRGSLFYLHEKNCYPLVCRQDPKLSWEKAVWACFLGKVTSSRWASTDTLPDLIRCQVRPNVGLLTDRVRINIKSVEALDTYQINAALPGVHCRVSYPDADGRPFIYDLTCAWVDFFSSEEEHQIFLAFFLCEFQGGSMLWVEEVEGVKYLFVGHRIEDCTRGFSLPQGRVRIVPFYEETNQGRRQSGSAPGLPLDEVLPGLERFLIKDLPVVRLRDD